MNAEVSTEVKSLNDIVRDKVKETFVGMIPDDQWNALVKKCTNDFLEKTLPEIVKDELSKRLKQQIADEISKAITDGRTDTYGRPKASQLVEMIIKTMTPDIINALIGGVAQEAVNQVQQRMRQGY